MRKWSVVRPGCRDKGLRIDRAGLERRADGSNRYISRFVCSSFSAESRKMDGCDATPVMDGNSLSTVFYSCCRAAFGCRCRYEPWVDQFSDQSNYKLMLGNRKPGPEDLRAATKMELTSGGSSSSSSSGSAGTVSVSVTKPSNSPGAPASSSSSSSTYAWKSAGFSQCSASCLGGSYAVSILLNFLPCRSIMIPHVLIGRTES